MPVLVSLRYLGPQADSFIGGHGVIGIDIRNETPNTVHAQSLVVETGPYWEPRRPAPVPALAPYSEGHVRLLLCGRAGAEAGDVPEFLTCRLTLSAVEVKLPLSFSYFSKSLEEWSPGRLRGAAGSPHFNLLLIGATGSAKSSFINSALTLVSHPSMLLL